MTDNISVESLLNDNLSDEDSSTKRSLRVKSVAGGLVDGNTDVPSAGNAVQLSATSKPCMGVFVSGDIGNANVVVVGTSTVVATSGSQRGIAVEPAGNSIFIPVNNLNLLYVDAITDGDNLIWAYLEVET